MLRSFCHLIAGICLALFSVPAFADDSPVVLTIYGNISHSNRGATDAFFDAFLVHHDRNFDKAQVFDRNALEKLEQQEFTVEAEGWNSPVLLQGPGLG